MSTSSNRQCCDGSTGLGDLFVFLGSVSADADCAEHFAIHNDGYAALERCCAAQGQRGDAAVANLIFEKLAGAAEDRCCPCLSDGDIHTGHLRIIEPFEENQVASIVHDGDNDRGTSLRHLCLSRGGNFLGGIERQHVFDRQLCRPGTGGYHQ